MLKTLPESELKINLKAKKEKFNQFRITNGKVSKEDLNLSNTHLEDIILETVNLTLEQISDVATSQDNTLATKTYSEKIKGGYFGKRRSRF